MKPWTTLQKRTRHCQDVFEQSSEYILFRSKSPGESAAAFNALAEGVAILSFMPRGVTVFGLHFESQHPDLKNASRAKYPDGNGEPACSPPGA